MPAFLFTSLQEKTKEWDFAKSKLMIDGKLLPNGTKLRRNDYPNDLLHSFIIVDDRIFALSNKMIKINIPCDAHTKLAQDEAGNIIVLKVRSGADPLSNADHEVSIPNDSKIVGQSIKRPSAAKSKPQKHYFVYEDLGTIETSPVALDRVETITLSRFRLENKHSSFASLARETRLENIHLLNALHTRFSSLYATLDTLSDRTDLHVCIKNYITSLLIESPRDEHDLLQESLKGQLDALQAIEKKWVSEAISSLIISLHHLRERYRTNHVANKLKESEETLRFENNDIDRPQIGQDSTVNSPIFSALPFAQMRENLIREFNELKATIQRVRVIKPSPLSSSFHPYPRNAEMLHAREVAIKEADCVLKALQAHLPWLETAIPTDPTRVERSDLSKSNRIYKALSESFFAKNNNMNKLAEVCSRSTHGLYFIANNGETFKGMLFCAQNMSVTTQKYDLNAHQANIDMLRGFARSFQDPQVKNLRKALFSLTTSLLLGVVILLGTGAGLSLPLFLGASAIATGTGFFASRERIPDALNNIDMKLPKPS